MPRQLGLLNVPLASLRFPARGLLGQFSPHHLFSPTELCQLPAEPGPCDAAITRFFYNSVVKKCVRFTYGGCGGNRNNFRTLEECQHACGGKWGKHGSKPCACPS